MSTTRVPSNFTTRRRRRGATPTVHSLPVCRATGEPRHRDRHQARQAADVVRRSSQGVAVYIWACLDCRGFHLEKTVRSVRVLDAAGPRAASAARDLGRATLTGPTRRSIDPRRDPRSPGARLPRVMKAPPQKRLRLRLVAGDEYADILDSANARTRSIVPTAPRGGDDMAIFTFRGTARAMYICRACGAECAYPSNFVRCPSCGIKWS